MSRHLSKVVGVVKDCDFDCDCDVDGGVEIEVECWLEGKVEDEDVVVLLAKSAFRCAFEFALAPLRLPRRGAERRLLQRRARKERGGGSGNEACSDSIVSSSTHS